MRTYREAKDRGARHASRDLKGAGRTDWRNPAGYAGCKSFAFFGLPPNLPLRRVAAVFDSVDASPPTFPESDAVQRLEPRKSGRSLTLDVNNGMR